MQNQEVNDYEPSWMMEENDAKHREETAPLLFGDGPIDLQDPATAPPAGSAASGGQDVDDDVVENSGPSSQRRQRRKKKGSRAGEGSKEGYGSVVDAKPSSSGGNSKAARKGGAAASSLAVPAGSDADEGDDEDEDTDVNDDDDEEDRPSKQQQQGATKKSSSLLSLFSGTSKAVAQTKKKKKVTEVDDNKKKKAVAPLTAAALRAKPHVPGINPCLWLFHTIQGVCVVSALLLCVTQVIPLVFAARQSKTGGGMSVLNTVGWASVALKAYITSFCLVFVAVETDLPVPFLRDSNLFQRYLSRGFLYSFVGLICLEEAYSERVRDIVKESKSLDNVGWAAIFMQISSWLMLAVGILYMLMGVCCLKGLRDRLRDNEQREWREYREALKRWKDVYT